MRTYLTYFFVSLTIFFIMATTSYLYLTQQGEYLSAREIVKRQLENKKIIFGSAIRNDAAYKIEALKIRQPEIVSLGSSRVMQFGERSFNGKFLNLGGVMGSVSDGCAVIDEIIAAGPEIVIIGLDVWWFHKDAPMAAAHKHGNINAYNPESSPQDIHKLMKYFLAGKITHKQNDNIGLSGKKGDGFYGDGFRHYGTTLTGESLNNDANFKDTFKRIKDGNRRFQHGDQASTENISAFVELVDKFEKHGIKTVIFFPPFASAVNEQIRKAGKHYDYISDLKLKLLQSGIRFTDYSQVDKIGGSDCEFIDGFHGGEITFSRILKDMHKNNILTADHINVDYINHLIENNSGMASSLDTLQSDLSEIDFLKLGCNKSRATKPIQAPKLRQHNMDL